MAFTKITGDPLNVLTPGMQLLTTSTASASATIDFDTGIDWTAYSKYVFELDSVVCATDDAVLWVRTSTDGGATYDAGVSYQYAYQVNGSSIGSIGRNASSQAQIAIAWDPASVGWSNVSTEPLQGTIVMGRPSLAAMTVLDFRVAGTVGGGSAGSGSCCGYGLSAPTTDVDGVRFLMSSGNITSGTFKLYGVA